MPNARPPTTSTAAAATTVRTTCDWRLLRAACWARWAAAARAQLRQITFPRSLTTSSNANDCPHDAHRNIDGGGAAGASGWRAMGAGGASWRLGSTGGRAWKCSRGGSGGAACAGRAAADAAAEPLLRCTWHSAHTTCFRQTYGSSNLPMARPQDRKSTRLNSSHLVNSYAVFCLKKKIQEKASSI